MKCSLCQSLNTNKSTCPLNPHSISIDYNKHIISKQTLLKLKTNYSKPDSTLNDKAHKFCRCVLHVMEKNSTKCNSIKPWKGNSIKPWKGSSNKCYNPYALCAKSTKTTTGSKSCDYNFDYIPIHEIRSYIQYNKIKFKLFLRTYNTKIKFNKIYNDDKLLRKYVIVWYNNQ